MPNPLNETLHVELELRVERASALKRVAHGLEKLLEELRELEHELHRTSGPERQRVERRYEEIREQTRKQLWYLIVQREAIGLVHHEDVYEIYKVPRSLTY